MKSQIIAAAIASALTALATASFAQSTPQRPFTHGESKRCETMTGSAKEQCDRDEARKTQGSEPEAAEGNDSAAGSSAAAGARDKGFTHGESKRCESTGLGVVAEGVEE